MDDALIEKTLSRAKFCKGDETGKVGVPLANGMMLYIEYHTVDKMNICDYAEEMTSEHYDWKTHGCKNREDWIRYLNKEFWKNL